jgi:hypothetical protein
VFLDRDGNDATMTFYCAFAVPIEDAVASAIAIADGLAMLSDAVITRVSLSWRATIDDPAMPAESSDISRKLLMLITNPDDEINAVIIPSPDADIFETTGSYAGIRLDLTHAGALAFADMLTTMEFRTDDNRQLGTDLVAGGLAL